MSGNSWLRRMLGATHVPGTNMTQKEWDNMTPMQQGLFNRSDGIGQTVAQMRGDAAGFEDGDLPNMNAPGKREAIQADLKYLEKERKNHGGVLPAQGVSQGSSGDGFLSFLKKWFDSN